MVLLLSFKEIQILVCQLLTSKMVQFLQNLTLIQDLRQVLFAQQENADETASGIVTDGNDLTANNKRIKLINDPVDAKDAANKQYVDGFVKRDGSLALTGDLDAGGNKIGSLGDGVNASDAVNKGQLDAGIETQT